MVEFLPRPIIDQSILIHVHTIGDYDEPESSSSGWFLLTDDDDDDLTKPQVMELFSNLMQDRPIPFRQGTRCVLRGSDLYEIGGNEIRHLNIEKQEDGWKTTALPINLGYPNTVIPKYRDFIYMFSSVPPFGPLYDNRHSPSPWACVYDTTKNECSYILDIPDLNNSLPHLSLYMPVEDGVQIYIGDRSCPDQPFKWFVHNVHSRKWKEKKIEESGYTKPFRDISRPFVISNNHLYIFDNTYFTGPVLYVYSIGGGMSSYNYIGMIQLPQLENMKYDFGFFMVPVSDYKISFIWYEKGGVGRRVGENFIVYAKIRVYLDTPAPTASLLKQAKIPIKATGINDCIAFSRI